MLNPLVSIIVITYNSAEFVLETLESAKAQTYQNIELIVSDDCSTDNTVEICEEWLENNKDRFVRTKLLTAKKNTGIPANCNRGVKASTGEWIKLIAGDDLFKKMAISDFVTFVYKNPNAKAIISKQQSFVINNNVKKQMHIRPFINSLNCFFYSEYSNPDEQLTYLLYRKVLIAGPTTFFKKELIVSLNYFNERYKLLEDYPFFLKMLIANNKIFFLDKITVEYRLHEKSVSFTNKKKIYSDYYTDWYSFLISHNFKKLSIIYKIDLLEEYIIYRIVLFLGNKGAIIFFLDKYLRKILISNIIRFFSKKICKLQ